MNEPARVTGFCQEERRAPAGYPLHRYPRPAASHLLSDQRVEVDSFEDGFGIDGSSIRGWAAINESDMLLIPDPTTAFMDPFMEVPTLVMMGDVRDPITKQNYERDPRWIAKKAETVPARTPASAIPLSSAPKPSSSSSTTSASTRTRTPASTSSMPKRAAGIPAARRTISATGRATRKAISRFRRPITIRICAPKWSRP